MEEIVSSIRKKLASRVSVFTDPEINLLENLLSKEFGPPEVPFAALPNFVGGPSFPAIGGPSSIVPPVQFSALSTSAGGSSFPAIEGPSSVDPSAALSTSFPATGSPSSWSPSSLFNDIEFENPNDEEMLPANEILEFSLPDVDDELFVSVQNNLSVFHNFDVKSYTDFDVLHKLLIPKLQGGFTCLQVQDLNMHPSHYDPSVYCQLAEFGKIFCYAKIVLNDMGNLARSFGDSKWLTRGKNKAICSEDKSYYVGVRRDLGLNVDFRSNICIFKLSEFYMLKEPVVEPPKTINYEKVHNYIVAVITPC